jgi:hypothetical protein
MFTSRVIIWLNSLAEKSKTTYVKVLNNFYQFKLEKGNNMNINVLVFEYINFLHDQGYVVRSQYSITCQWCRIVHNKDIMKENFENKKFLAQWGKDEVTKKSKVLMKEEIGCFIEDFPNDDTFLAKRLLSSLGFMVAAVGANLSQLNVVM